MLADLIIGSLFKQDGAQTTQRASKTGATVTTDAHGRYYEAASRGRIFYLNVNGAAATAFTGGAAGTPLIGVYNPPGSNKIFNVIGCMVNSRVAGSAAGTTAFNIWGGPSATPTGTLTVPTNMYSLQATDSAAKGIVNAAMTSSTALAQICPIGAYYWASAAGSMFNSGFIELNGLVVAIPGNLIALGATTVLTSATYDATLFWEEAPL